MPAATLSLPLISGYRPDAILIWQRGTGVSQAQFLGAAATLAVRLPASATHILPLAESRAAFMVAFAAGLLSGRPCLLPSTGSNAAIASLRLAHPAAIVLSDTAAHCTAAGDLLMNTAFDDAVWVEATAPQIPAAQLAAIVHTSGSTGTPKAEPKSWAALVATAERASARFFKGVNIVATVPPQHMFGLEASVMLALAAGCTVDAVRPFFPADVAAALASLPAPRLLVTTPVHLRALVAAGVQLPKLGMVLSATAPLAIELAERVETLFHAPLYEIYGCTEAGSLATRRTTRDADWRLYPDLRLEADEDGTLLHASYLPGPVRLSDDIELLDAEHFRLLGRSSEMLKVAGKRIALGEITQALLAIPGVEDGVVFAPEVGAAIERPAALVVAPGLSVAQVLAALSLKLDAVFLPRPLKLVAKLPRNAVGKISRAALLEALNG